MIVCLSTLTKKPLEKITPSDISATDARPVGVDVSVTVLNSLLFEAETIAPVFSVTVTSSNSSSPPKMKEPARSVPDLYDFTKSVKLSVEVAATEVITFATTPVVLPLNSLP